MLVSDFFKAFYDHRILIKDIPWPHEKYTNNVGNKSQTHFSFSLSPLGGRENCKYFL